MKTSIFKVNDLVMYQHESVVLDHISFELYQGETLGILGLNDSGILALTDILTGKLRAWSGEIYYGGERLEYHSVKEARACGIYGITQQTTLIPRLSILENLTVIGNGADKNFIIQRKHLKRQIQETLEEYGAKPDLKKRIFELSGFERQLIEIYKAIENDVKILCLYGIGENCTAEENRILQDILERMKKNGIGILFIHYSSDKVRKFCDRILVARHGFIADEVNNCETTDQELLRRIAVEDRNGELREKCIDKKREKKYTVSYEMHQMQILTGEITGIIKKDFSPDGLQSWDPMLHVAYYEKEFWKKDIFDNFTLEENIMLKSYKYYRKLGFILNRKMIHFVLKESCDRYDFDYEGLKKYPRDASEKRLKEIIMFSWLINPADILVLEDPFYAADEEIISFLYKYTGILKQRGTAIVCGGNNRTELFKIADRVIDLD